MVSLGDCRALSVQFTLRFLLVSRVHAYVVYVSVDWPRWLECVVGDAWLELLAGAKRWAIYSMGEVGTPPGGYAEARPHGAWQEEVYPELVEGRLRGPLPLECVQYPGEVVYVSKTLP